jgi:hypothetical protein
LDILLPIACSHCLASLLWPGFAHSRRLRQSFLGEGKAPIAQLWHFEIIDRVTLSAADERRIMSGNNGVFSDLFPGVTFHEA